MRSIYIKKLSLLDKLNEQLFKTTNITVYIVECLAYALVFNTISFYALCSLKDLESESLEYEEEESSLIHGKYIRKLKKYQSKYADVLV